MSHINPTKQNTPEVPATGTLTNAQTAALMGVSTKYLNNMRYAGRGPAFIRLSRRRVVYNAAVVAEWMQAHTVKTGATLA